MMSRSSSSSLDTNIGYYGQIRKPTIPSGKRRHRTEIGESNRREFMQLKDELLKTQFKGYDHTPKNEGIISEKIDTLTSTVKTNPLYGRRATTNGRDINLWATPFSDEETFATKYQTALMRNASRCGMDNGDYLVFQATRTSSTTVTSTDGSRNVRERQRSKSLTRPRSTSDFDPDTQVVNARAPVPTRLGRTQYPDTRHLTQPDPDTPLYADSKGRFQTHYERVLGAKENIAAEEASIKQARYDAKLDRRRRNEERVLQTYQKAEEEKWEVDKRRVIGACKQKIQYLEAIAKHSNH